MYSAGLHIKGEIGSGNLIQRLLRRWSSDGVYTPEDTSDDLISGETLKRWQDSGREFLLNALLGLIRVFEEAKLTLTRVKDEDLI
jgi:hypothetical protein